MSTLLQGRSIDTVIEEITRLAGSGLQFEEDLRLLITLTDTPEREMELESLAFSAKYCLGLMRVIRKGTGNAEIGNLDQIKSDLNTNLQKMRNQLSSFISYADNDVSETFHKKFLAMDPSAFSSFLAFLESLEWLKFYFNSLKRS